MYTPFYKTWWFRVSVVLLLGVIAFWYNDFGANQRYLDSTSQYRDMYESAVSYDLAAKASIAEEEAMLRADTYGGKTPEETLSLFVDALGKGDARLASKYYMPWLQDEAEKEMAEWVKDDSLKIFLDIYEQGSTKRDESYVNGLSLDVYGPGEDQYPYTVKMEENRVKKIWKITEF